MALVDVRGYNLDPNVAGSLQQGMQFGQALGQQDRAAQIRGLLSQQGQPTQPVEGAPSGQAPTILSQEDLIAQARKIDPAQANKILGEMGLDDKSKREEMSRFAAQVQAMPYDKRQEMINARAKKLQSEGRDPSETLKLLNLSEDNQNRALTAVQLMDLSTKERFAVTSNLQKALGEKGPSDVQSAKILEDGTVQFVRKDGTVEIKSPSAANAEIIKNAKEFGVDLQQKRSQARGLGKDAAQASSKAVDQLQSIRSNNSTLRQVVDEVRGGAETGPLADKLPSFRAATVRLNQLKNKLGLDVVGAVTFGALSEGELKLALNTALPTNLQGPELIEWAEKKIDAQEKLATYLEDQAIFLGNSGNTRADWLVQQKEQAKSIPESPTTPQQGAPKFLGFE